jgi:hypothetical protein
MYVYIYIHLANKYCGLKILQLAYHIYRERRRLLVPGGTKRWLAKTHKKHGLSSRKKEKSLDVVLHIYIITCNYYVQYIVIISYNY